MSSIETLEAVYTSAPIVDYDEEPGREVTDADLAGGSAGLVGLESEAFDAAILEALVKP